MYQRTGLYSQFPIPDSQFPIPNSQFPIPTSRFPIPDSQFPIPNSQFPIPMITAKLEKTYALVVGIEKYQESAFNVKGGGPARDAIKFARWLLGRGVPTGNIWLCLSLLEENLALVEEAAPLKVWEATEQQLSYLISDRLSQQAGDLLFIFWAGHGMITSATDRRLLCADATQLNWQNLDLNSLLIYLRSSAFGIRRHICIIDACANYIDESQFPRPTNFGGKTFPQGKPTKDSKQYVLLAAREGITAKVSGERQTGYFSEAVREELAQATDNSWPPDMEKLTRDIKQRFAQSDNRELVKRLPIFFYYRGWDGDEEQYFPSRLTAPHNLPRSGVVKFVGRDKVLLNLHQQLQQTEQVAISAVAGMGGVGKTELALQYAWRHRQEYRGGICWLEGSRIATEVIDFARIYLELKIRDDLDLRGQVNYCWQYWFSSPLIEENQDKVLVVIDNVTSYQQVKDYLPPAHSQFRVLLTTRKQLEKPVQLLELPELDEAAALELLKSLTDEARIEGELEDAKELCLRLGYLPLGLELVGRYLDKRKGLSLAEMLARLAKKGLTHKSLDEPKDEMTAKLGVKAAFELSWEALDADSEAQLLGCFLSLFAAAPIPWDLVEKGLPESDTEDLEDARVALEELHLLQLRAKSSVGAKHLGDNLSTQPKIYNPNASPSEIMKTHPKGEDSYQLHPLIREFFRYKREESAEVEEMKRGFVAAMVEVAKQIPQSITLELVENFQPAISHLQEVAKELMEFVADEDVITPCDRLGRFYQGQGFYDLAEPWLEKSQAVVATRLGNEHPNFANSLNSLALLYTDQGRYEEAEPLYQQAIEIDQRSLPSDHPLLAISLNNLAQLYSYQGRYTEAEPLLQQTIEIVKRSLPQDHPDLATNLNNLALLYTYQGRYEEAEPLLQQTIEIVKRSLPQDHPLLAANLSNLANLYYSQGRYTEAEPLSQRAINIAKHSLPQEHPELARNLNNLALLYYSQGRYEEAEPLYEKAIEIAKRSLPQDHPLFATYLSNLALLYYSQGRYEEAEPLYEQVIKVTKRSLPQDHPSLATYLSNLANLYYSQGRYEEAEPFYKQAISIAKRSLPQGHPELARNLNNLAELYRSQGRCEEAEPLYEQVIEITKRSLPQDHPSLATYLSNLALLYYSQGRYEEAEPFYKQAISIAKRSLPQGHPELARNLNNLAE
ncbi:MAG: tetratricopeptide repeat protein, partial [Symploca sp. SIO2G7]|nr:tetratricopeptide repeat protein [Symploca sp. SIO2G7]